MSRYAIDTVKECEQSVWSFVHFFFLECQTGISTIHQLLNVSTRPGPLYSSATSGKMTRQSSVCHKLSEIIDACCCCVPLSLSYDLFQSFTFNNTAELKGAIYPRLQLSSAVGGVKEVGMGLNISARRDSDLAAIIWSAWIKHEDDMGNTACSLRDSGDCPPRQRGARLTVAITVTLAFTKSAPWDLRHAEAGCQGSYLTWRHNFHLSPQWLLSSALQKFNQCEGNQIPSLSNWWL